MQHLFASNWVRGSIASLLLAAPTLAQGPCPGWDPRFSGFNEGPRYGYCLETFDPGSGPKLFIGHDGGVATWNGAVFAGSGISDGPVADLLTFSDASGPAIYAARAALTGGSLVRRWNGTSSTAVGNLVGGYALALAGFDDGTGPALYAGGLFPVPGSTSSANVAHWNGSTWLPLGSGTNGVVRRLLAFDDGSGPALYATGTFTQAGGVPVTNLARWNGTSWSAVGTVPAGYGGGALTVGNDGSGIALYASGTNPTSNVGRWNGTTWTPVGNFHGAARVLHFHDDGTGNKLYTTGVSTEGQNGLHSWDGSTWSQFGFGLFGIFGDDVALIADLESYDDGAGGGPDLFLSGTFDDIGGVVSVNLASWRGCSTPGPSYCDCSIYVGGCPVTGGFGRGCNNSASTGGAMLSASGSTRPDTVAFTCSGLLPTGTSTLIQSSSSAPFGTGPFGHGILCLGGSIVRLYTKGAVAGTMIAPGAGDAPISQRSGLLGAHIPRGSTRYYQVLYRDGPVVGCAPSTGNFNASNAVRVVW